MSDNWDKDFGSLLARARNQYQMSQTQLAELMVRAGHDTWRQNTVSRIEAGNQSVSAEHALCLALILDESIYPMKVPKMISSDAQLLAQELLETRGHLDALTRVLKDFSYKAASAVAGIG